MFDFDSELAERYGACASYQSTAYPSSIEYYGENPSVEFDRLLKHYTTLERSVLDLGCGAGHTLCQLAPHVKRIWGVDSNQELLNAAYLRINRLQITNASLIFGCCYDVGAMKGLPDATFDLVFSRRGPRFDDILLRTLRKEAIFIQELVSNLDGYPLGEIFGRRYYPTPSTLDQEVILSGYMKIGFLPVSCKEYFYEEFFRDKEHLATFLIQIQPMLSPWLLPQPEPQPTYNPLSDQDALQLYATYNTTPKGIRVLRQRKVLVLRQTRAFSS